MNDSLTQQRKLVREKSLNVMNDVNKLLQDFHALGCYRLTEFRTLVLMNNPELENEKESTIKTFFSGSCRNEILFKKFQVALDNVQTNKEK